MGKPIDDNDLISYILSGLNPAYIGFITTFNFSSRLSTISFEDFQAELLNHEILLANQQHSSPGNQQYSSNTELGNFALFSQKPKHFKGIPYGQHKRNQYNNQRHSEGNFYSKNLASGHPNHLNTTRAPCQICGKSRHQALDYFKRMTFSYQGQHPLPSWLPWQ